MGWHPAGPDRGRRPLRRSLLVLLPVGLLLAGAACWEDPTFGPDVRTGTIAHLILQPGNVQMVRGEADAVRAVALDSAGVELEGVDVRWTVADTAVARVDSRSGQVRAAAVGRTRLTARAGDVSSSVPVSVLPPFVGPGADHTCALVEGGGAACWGRGASGQLGGGAMEGSPAPVAVSGLPEATDVATGYLHSCALDAEGAAFCWGRGVEGQLGHGALGQEPAPVPVGSGHRYSEIVAGARHTCAVGLDDITRCWGWNRHGQLGMGHRVGLFLPGRVQPEDRPLHGLAAGGVHTCAVGPDGRAFCWGRNADGQVGDGTRAERTLPAEVVGGRRFTGLAAGSAHTCGFTPEGVAWCWGSDAYGQLGDGGGPGRSSARPVRVEGGHRFQELVAGTAHTCGLTADGAAFCWGLGAFGQLGPDAGSSDRPVPVHPNLRFEALAAGSGHVCGVTPGGAARCWGLGAFGQLGHGRRESSADAEAVTGAFSFRGFGGGE